MNFSTKPLTTASIRLNSKVTRPAGGRFCDVAKIRGIGIKHAVPPFAPIFPSLVPNMIIKSPSPQFMVKNEANSNDTLEQEQSGQNLFNNELMTQTLPAPQFDSMAGWEVENNKKKYTLFLSKGTTSAKEDDDESFE